MGPAENASMAGFWWIIMWIAIAGFGLMILVCSVGGFLNILDLFRTLREEHTSDEGET